MERAIVISSQLINLREVRYFLEEVYRASSLNITSFNYVFLGISEAVNNSILHGNKLDPEKKVFIRTRLCGNQLHIEIEDEGDGFCDAVLFDPTTPENIKCEHGRGIFILKKLADNLIFKDRGRKVIITFNLP